MLAKDIREMSEGDIKARIAELEEESFRLRFRAGTETLEDPLHLRVIRRDIARLNTVLREKIIGIAESGISGKAKPSGSAKPATNRSRKIRSARKAKRA